MLYLEIGEFVYRCCLYFFSYVGNIGNQIAQFLGTLALAKEMNRTLVLPPLAYVSSSDIHHISFFRRRLNKFSLVGENRAFCHTNFPTSVLQLQVWDTVWGKSVLLASVGLNRIFL